ncbi:hypothetical protein IU436_29225 [Nocardia farcinica]|uniref:hypothetical protein n=1 Tax=Nocardia farcinica TaxID=37329 RepID=UPI0018963BE1|nr:hypothetical protein [Nocardia farcinica]MBF6422951.1 hypothetical protein [Nocardia farcinica]MBF6434408.1 hypothetical protein [Nocardia farcinica]MBF6505474.1 hypothetical protein [Nocardia farcinica]
MNDNAADLLEQYHQALAVLTELENGYDADTALPSEAATYYDQREQLLDEAPTTPAPVIAAAAAGHLPAAWAQVTGVQSPPAPPGSSTYPKPPARPSTGAGRAGPSKRSRRAP